jgi:hypothetical protein
MEANLKSVPFKGPGKHYTRTEHIGIIVTEYMNSLFGPLTYILDGWAIFFFSPIFTS